MRSQIQIYKELKEHLSLHAQDDKLRNYLLIAPEKYPAVIKGLMKHSTAFPDHRIMIGNIKDAEELSVVFTYSEVESRIIDDAFRRLIDEGLITIIEKDYPPELYVFDPNKKEDPTFFNPFKYVMDGGSMIEAKSVLGNHFKTYGEDHPAYIADATDLDAYYFYVFVINWNLLKLESKVLPENVTIELSSNRDVQGKFTLTLSLDNTANLLGHLALSRTREGFKSEKLKLLKSSKYSSVILALMLDAKQRNRSTDMTLNEVNTILNDFGLPTLGAFQHDSFRKSIAALAANKTTPPKLAQILPLIFGSNRNSFRLETSVEFSANFPQ